MKRSAGFIVLVSAAFAAWIILLAILAAFSGRDPVFHDSLGNVDVTGQYVSEIPLWRYVMEPFAGFAYTIVQYPIDALICIVIGYAALRVVLLLLERGYFRENVKAKVLATLLRDTTNFFCKYIGIGLAIGLAILLPGWAIAGFHFFMITYMGGVRILVGYGLVILGIKIAWNAAILFRQRGVLRVAPAPSWTSLPRRSTKYWACKVPEVFARELRYTIATIFVVLVAFFTLAGARLPNYVTRTSLGPNEHLIDFHVHTWYSDGSLSPADRVEWYIQQGITGAAFTDHDNMRGAIEAKQYVEQNNRPFVVILAQEYTDLVHDIHLNIYGTTEQFAPLDQYSPLYPDVHFVNVSDCIMAAKVAGGFVIVNHYSGLPGSPYTYADLLSWGIDGFELVNGGHEHSDDIRQFCNDNGLACVGGTDEHMNKDVNTFVKITLPDPSNVGAMFAALKLNTHQVVLVDYTTNPMSLGGSIRRVNLVRPLLNYFLNLDGGQYASWIAWSGLLFVSFLLFTSAVRRMDACSMERKILIDARKKWHLLRQLAVRIASAGGR